MTDRLTDKELDALLEAHDLREAHVLALPDCVVCHTAWPCEKWRLTTEVKELRAVVDAVVVGYPGGDYQCLICHKWDVPDESGRAQHESGCPVARYEEGGR